MEYLPPKPVEPLENECCGSGCTLCVFDIYQRDLEKWERECSVLAINSGRESCKETHRDFISTTEFKQFELLAIIPHASDTAIYRFKLPIDNQLDLESGQHLILRSWLDGKHITRSYTPIDSEVGYFDIMIKIYPNGQMSKSICKWSVGDMIDWRGPFGNLKYIPNQYTHIVMLAAGTGIAPMLQMIKIIIDNEDDETFIKLFYSCKRAADILMKQRIDGYKQFWNFQAVYFLTQSQKDNDVNYLKYGDEVMYQRIDEEFLSMNLPRMLTKILICGTKSFEKDMMNYCTRIGYNEEHIFKF